MEEDPPNYNIANDSVDCLSQIKELIKYIRTYSSQPDKSILKTISDFEKGIESMFFEDKTKGFLKLKLNSPLRLHEIRNGISKSKSIPGISPQPIPLCSTNPEILKKYTNYVGVKTHIDLNHNI